MNKQRKIPRYKQILALGDTSDMTAAEIADKLDLCVTDVTTAIYHAQKAYGVDIPYVKVYSGGKVVGSKPKPPVAAKRHLCGRFSARIGKMTGTTVRAVNTDFRNADADRFIVSTY